MHGRLTHGMELHTAVAAAFSIGPTTTPLPEENSDGAVLSLSVIYIS